MDDKKIIDLKLQTKDSDIPAAAKPEHYLHTNPIIQKMLRCNEISKKIKFKLKDLF